MLADFRYYIILITTMDKFVYNLARQSDITHSIYVISDIILAVLLIA